MELLSILPYLASAALSWAAPSDFFPLQVGNQWILQSASANPKLLKIEVLRSRLFNNSRYFLVSGYAPGQRWVRQADDGILFVLDETSGKETILARLTIGGTGYETPLSGCAQPAQPSAETAAYRGPNFELASSLVIKYQPGGCADIGITNEVYAQKSDWCTAPSLPSSARPPPT